MERQTVSIMKACALTGGIVDTKQRMRSKGLATVTREQRAIEAWAKAMATAENYAVDPHQHIARLVEAGEQMAALLAPKDAAALASPPAEDELQRHDCEAWAMEGIGCAHCNPVALAIRAAPAPPASAPTPQDITNLAALIGNVLSVMGHSLNISESDRLARAIASQWRPASDQPGPTVINEDDGDVTIDFDYANDRVVSIRLGEESSGLSAFVDGESHALCPLDRVPPKVLALLRTEAKAVTLRQSDPPGLVDVVRAWQEARTARMELFKKWECDEYRPAPFDEVSSISFRMDEATKALDAYPLPASPQAETKGDE